MKAGSGSVLNPFCFAILSDSVVVLDRLGPMPFLEEKFLFSKYPKELEKELSRKGVNRSRCALLDRHRWTRITVLFLDRSLSSLDSEI